VISRLLSSRLGLAAAFLLAASAHAGIVASSGLNVIAPPASVQPGALVNDTTPFLFQESGPITTASSVDADIVVDPNSLGGTYTSPFDLTPGTFLPGTIFSGSYFFHFNRTAGSTSLDPISVSATFTDNIIAIILLDATLDSTDPIFGNPGTLYPTGTPGRGFILGDGVVGNGLVITIDGNTINANFDPTAADLEQIRVLTATPEPGSIGLLASGLAGLAYLARRRRAAR
jgi:hypothetical protein